MAALAAGAGASFAARGDAYHVQQTTKLIEQGIAHKGFSIIDCLTICPTYYGRKNKKGGAVEMMKFQKENFITSEAAKNKSAEELQDKRVIGIVTENSFPELTEEYAKLIERAKAKAGGKKA